MKKIITSIAISLAGALCAFAITDAQKAAFKTCIDANVKGDDFAATVEAAAAAPEVKSIAAWAESDPAAFREFLGTLKGNSYIWAVRKCVNRQFDAGSLHDAVINDYAATNSLAGSDEGYFNELKGMGFAPAGGIRMSDSQIFALAVKYADMETFKLLPEKVLAERFGEYLAAIRKARLSPEDAYRIYSELSTNFAEYKASVKTVGDNWEALQTDKNEAFMAYYAEKKLEALNK